MMAGSTVMCTTANIMLAHLPRRHRLRPIRLRLKSVSADSSGASVNSMRVTRAGPRPARTFSRFGGAVATLLFAAAPLPSSAAPAVAASAAPLAASYDSNSGINDFYRARGNRPLWLAPQSGGAGQLVLGLLNSAAVDGLDPNRYQVRKVADALRAAQNGNGRAVNRAELMLSQAFVAYARDL